MNPLDYTSPTTLNRYQPRLQPVSNPRPTPANRPAPPHPGAFRPPTRHPTPGPPAYLPPHPVVHASHTHCSSISARLRLCLAITATGLSRSPHSTPQVCVAYASLRATDCKPSKAKARPSSLQQRGGHAAPSEQRPEQQQQQPANNQGDAGVKARCMGWRWGFELIATASALYF